MTQIDARIDANTLAEIDRITLELPFHRMCGLTLESREPGRAVSRFVCGSEVVNPAGVLHGGILYAMLDVACFLAAAPLMAPGERIVSHDVHVSVMAAAPADAVIEMRAEVMRKGRSVAFIRAEAWRIDVDEPTIIGAGTVTKSVLQPAPAGG